MGKKHFPRPKMPASRKQLISTVTDVGEVDGLQVMTVSTAGVDRDGDRVLPEGMDARSYRANPVLLWAHDYHALPIGTVSRLDVQDGVGIKASFNFLEGDEFAQRVKNAWEQGAVRSASIGFKPTEWQANKTEGYDINRWELLEVSLCPIPANPDAVRTMKSLGVLPVEEGEGEQDTPLQTPTPTAAEEPPMDEPEAIETKGVVPSNPNDKRAEEGTAWSAPTLGDFVSGSWDDLSATERRQIASHFAWAAQMPPATFGDLKLPHHRASDGAVVWRGVANAMARANQASIPSADLGKVRAHLRAHYAQFDKPVPEDEAEVPVEKGDGSPIIGAFEKVGRIQARRNEERLRRILQDVQDMLAELLPDEPEDDEEPETPTEDACDRKPKDETSVGASVVKEAAPNGAGAPLTDPCLDLTDAPDLIEYVDSTDGPEPLEIVDAPAAPVVYEVDTAEIVAVTKKALTDTLRDLVASALARARGRLD